MKTSFQLDNVAFDFSVDPIKVVRERVKKVPCQICGKVLDYTIRASNLSGVVAIAEAEHCGHRHKVVVRIAA